MQVGIQNEKTYLVVEIVSSGLSYFNQVQRQQGVDFGLDAKGMRNKFKSEDQGHSK